MNWFKRKPKRVRVVHEEFHVSIEEPQDLQKVAEGLAEASRENYVPAPPLTQVYDAEGSKWTLRVVENLVYLSGEDGTIQAQFFTDEFKGFVAPLS